MHNPLLKYLIIILLLPFFSIGQGGNLVPNGGFENYTTCPNIIGGVDYAFPWDNPPNVLSSADFMHNCGYAMYGSWYTTSGNPYMGDGVGGIRVMADQNINTYCEYLQVQLTAPLIAGQYYEVSFYSFLGETTTGNANSLGVVLTDASILTAGLPTQNNLQGTFQPCFPQVMMNGTGYWELQQGIYLAQGGEEYLTIGNFYSPSNLNVIGQTAHCFYLIDEVKVIPYFSCELEIENSVSNLPVYDVTICQGDSVTLSVNAFVSTLGGFWNTGDTTAQITVDTSGIYVYTLNIPNCNLIDSVEVSLTQPPTFYQPDTTLCLGDTLNISSPDSSLSLNLYWNNILIDYGQNVQVQVPYVYEITLADGFCESVRDTFNFSILDSPIIQPLLDTTLCEITSFNYSSNVSDYDSLYWSTGSSNQQTTINDTGTYVLEAFNKCGTDTDTFEVFLHQMIFDVNLMEDTLLCTDTIFEFVAVGNDIITTWNDGIASNVRELSEGLWSYLIQDTLCTYEDTVSIRIAQEFELLSDTLLCDDENIFVQLQEVWIDSLRWSNGGISTDEYFSEPGIYTVYVYQEHCSYTDTFQLEKLYTPTITDIDTTLCIGEVFQYNATPTYDYAMDGQPFSNIYYLGSPGSYSIQATNYCGTTVANLVVRQAYCFCPVYIPNTFTPNGDGLIIPFV